jgi:hypothetical protein
MSAVCLTADILKGVGFFVRYVLERKLMSGGLEQAAITRLFT